MGLETKEFPRDGWYAAHVRYQREQAVAAMLEARELETYVPTYRERKQWSDRVKEMEKPLFPGYVFCRMDRRNWLTVQSTAGVVKIVGIGNRPVEIDPTEMVAIQKLVETGMARMPVTYASVGDFVEVKGGPMDGCSGILKQVKNARTLIVSIGLLKRSVAIDLADGWVTVSRKNPASQPAQEETACLSS